MLRVGKAGSYTHRYEYTAEGGAKIKVTETLFTDASGSVIDRKIFDAKGRNLTHELFLTNKKGDLRTATEKELKDGYAETYVRIHGKRYINRVPIKRQEILGVSNIILDKERLNQYPSNRLIIPGTDKEFTMKEFLFLARLPGTLVIKGSLTIMGKF